MRLRSTQSFKLQTTIAAMNKIFNYGIDQLTIGRTIAIASGNLKAVLNEPAIQKIKASQQHVASSVADNHTV